MLKRILQIILGLALFTPLLLFRNTVFPFVFPKAIAFQILVSLAFILFVFLWSRGEIQVRWRTTIGLALGVYLAAITIASLAGVDWQHSFWDAQERMTGIWSLLHYAVFFLMIVSVYDQPRDQRRFAIVLWAVAALLMLSGLVQIINPNFWGYPAVSRVAGLLNNPIFYASTMVFGIFISLFLAVTETRLIKKIIFFVSGVFFFYAIYASGTRGAMVGVVVGLLLYGLAEVIIIKDRRRRYGLLGLLLAAVVLLAGLWFYRDSAFVKGLPFASFLNLSPFSGTGATRLIAWQAAWRGWLAHPVFGWGLNNFNIIFNQFYNPESLRYTAYETWFDRAHNVFLEHLTTTGAVGLLAYLGIFAAATAVLYKNVLREKLSARAGLLLAGGLAAYMIQNMFALDEPTSLLFFYSVLAIITMSADFAPVAPPLKRRTVFWPLVVSLVMIFSIYQYDIIPVYAGYLDVVGEATADTNYQYATIELNQALALNHPYRFDSVLEFVQVTIKASINGQITSEALTKAFLQSETLMKGLANEHPYNAYYWYLLGRMYAEWGRHDAQYFSLGEQAFERGRVLSPDRQQIFFGLGEMYLFAKEYDKAEVILKHNVDLEPRVGEAHWYLGLLYDQIGQNDKANIEFEAAYQNNFNPTSEEELNVFVNLFTAQKRYQDIALVYERYISNQPSVNGAFYAKEASAWLAAGNFDRAREALANAVKFDPSLIEDGKTFSKMIDAAEARSQELQIIK